SVSDLIRSVLAVDLSELGLEKELVIVNDASSDRTLLALTAFQNHPRIRIISHDRNEGKGAALQTGFSAATGDISIVQDADLEYDPNEYPKILKPITSGK